MHVADPGGNLDAIALLAGEVVPYVVDYDRALERAAQPRKVFDEHPALKEAVAPVQPVRDEFVLFLKCVTTVGRTFGGFGLYARLEILRSPLNDVENEVGVVLRCRCEDNDLEVAAHLFQKPQAAGPEFELLL